jgi:uncharacterized protein YebE (UPF0316 family)
MLDLSSWTVPLLIFAAEMCVVTLATLRIIFIGRGHTVLAPTLGFGEIVIWLFAVGKTMQNLHDPACFLAFALGFTLGNLLGIVIEKKLAMGMVNVRIITHRDASDLIDALRAASFGVTCVNGQGATGPVQVVMSIVKRRQLAEVVALIQEYHPQAFYAVEDLQTASAGIFPLPRSDRAAMAAALQ